MFTRTDAGQMSSVHKLYNAPTRAGCARPTSSAPIYRSTFKPTELAALSLMVIT